MRRSVFSVKSFHLPILGLLWVISACGGPSNQPVNPVATITAPPNNSSYSVGQEVDIAFSAADVSGISQVELLVDGQAIRVQTVNPPVNSFVATEPWTPETPGSHVVEVRAFNVAGQASDAAQIVVIVNAPVAEVEPTETPVPTATRVPVLPTPTPAPPSPTPTVVEQAAPNAIVTSLVALNVRAGPSTDFPVIGRLAEGETAEIVGRDEFTTWWQIVHPPGSSDRGWVAAASQFTSASNADGVPITDTPAPPTVGPTEPPPTHTPDALKPTIFSFTADRYAIAPGETVALSWDLANAQSAFLQFDGTEEGVVAPGNKIVSPTKDTVYTLVARNEAGDTTAQVTITVNASPPTPPPVLRDGKTGIVSGQTLDFDKGVVYQGTGTAGGDFFWDGQQKRFLPQGSAVGTLLQVDYNGIALPTCLGASYGQPIPQVDPATLITGCYRTNKGRYGKFYVTEWDLSGNLTVAWLTWDYP